MAHESHWRRVWDKLFLKFGFLEIAKFKLYSIFAPLKTNG